VTHTLEPADLDDPDLDHLADTYDRYVQDLLDERAELIAQHRTRSIALECIEQDLWRLGVEL